jgi:predicted amidohydrolase
MAKDRSFLAALVGLRSGRSVAGNIDAAARLIGEAADAGAAYVQTPEMTSILERDRKALFAAVTEEARDPALAAFRDLARSRKIWLHLGSLAIRTAGERIANRAFLIDPAGEVAASYDKIHMFDVDLPMGERWRESNTYQPGETAVAADLPWGRLGLTICYDLRFPALHQALAEAGAEFLAVPAAFTRQTGEAHWHILNRARAIETGSFVLAAAQSGHHEDGRGTWGRSMIIGPWGEVLARAEDDAPGVLVADLDLDAVAKARGAIPSLANAREFSGP